MCRHYASDFSRAQRLIDPRDIKASKVTISRYGHHIPDDTKHDETTDLPRPTLRNDVYTIIVLFYTNCNIIIIIIIIVKR